MTQTSNKITRVVSDRTRRWLPLAVISCVLLSPGLWADELKVDQTAATEATLAEAEKPAIVAPGASVQSSKPSAASKKQTAVMAKINNPYPDFKPPAVPKPTAFSSQELDAEVVKAIKERWGVELLGIRQSAAGMFLDFRFKVLDAEKSLPLFDHQIKPYLVADKSDIKLPVPMAAKVGAFRPTNRGKNIKADKTYYMLFANPDRYVKSGEQVSVVIGDFKAEQLIVQ